MEVGDFSSVTCFTPLKGCRTVGGGVAFGGEAGRYVDRPVVVACGQCIGCRAARARSWALRCMHESSLHARNSFVTLTYSPSMLPKDGSLDVRDWQLFAKRVRRTMGSFRFLSCGEYGARSLRPHFHALIFGHDFSHDRIDINKKLYTSPTLERLWGKGMVSVGPVVYQTAAYVANYILKKATGKLSEERYMRYDSTTGECWQVRPEFITMSRKPGLGTGWLEKYSSDVYPSDEVVFDGKKFRPPRFYDSKLPEEVLAGYKAKRVMRARERAGDYTPARLRVQEEVALSNLARKERDSC